MTIFSLSKCGYGSINELNQLSSKEFYDLIEFEKISGAIEKYRIDKAKSGH